MKQYISSMPVSLKRGMGGGFPTDPVATPHFAAAPDDYRDAHKARTKSGPAIVRRRNGVIEPLKRKAAPEPTPAPVKVAPPAALSRRDPDGTVTLL